MLRSFGRRLLQLTRPSRYRPPSSTMDPNEDAANDDYSMLDRLAYDCTRLAKDLAASAASPDKQNRLLADYIERADRVHRTIPDFADDLDWFNVTEPLSVGASLRGKIVILDFFTYCCINCLHVLPDLRRLEQLYTVADGLVVIGVHSAKFANEKDSANILSAVQRHNITHPVVNDSEMAMWQQLDVKCWPTLLVLGPTGRPLFVLMGEGHYEQLERYVGAAIKYFGAAANDDDKVATRPRLSDHALPLNPAVDLIVSGSLQFPGKVTCSHGFEDVVATAAGEELFAVVDSGHHRVLVLNAAGTVLYRIGGKQPGFADGDFRQARFNSPQGVCFRNSRADELFVADTENHSIRRVDLRTRRVETVAGTGEPGADRVGGARGCEQALSSPWDVTVCRTRNMDMSFHANERDHPECDVLLIADAGLHQIWAMFLDATIWWKYRRYAAGEVVALVGNGNEENRNNSYPANAAFAQPSGLALRADTKELFVADSESSSVRKVQLVDGKVLAVAGGDRNPLNLFAFGDIDGKQYAAKLQHPLGVAYNAAEQAVYVADTYNHRIKRIDVNTNVCEAYKFRGPAGQPLDLSFHEPGGLCVNGAGDMLYVADTNNHRIVRIRLTSGRADVWPLQFDVARECTDGAPPANGRGGGGGGQSAASNSSTRMLRADRPLRLGSAIGSMTRLRLSVEFVSDCDTTNSSDDSDAVATSMAQLKLTADAPQHIAAAVSDPTAIGVRTLADRFSAAHPKVLLEVEALTAAADRAASSLTLAFRLNLCAADVCFPRAFALEIPIENVDGGDAETEGAERTAIVDWRVLVQRDGVELSYDNQ